ncbi:MAG: hypothetical protein RQ824_05990 [bacterium]|nr:hypothetical protein [bacterium]
MKKKIISLITIAIIALFAGLCWSAENEELSSLQHSESAIAMASNDVDKGDADVEAPAEEEESDVEAPDSEDSDDETPDEETPDEETPKEGDLDK